MDSTLHDTVIADTQRWLERAVIGLNLCPFAKGVYSKNQIHFAVSPATDMRGVLQNLQQELEALAEISPDKRDTTLLMVPLALQDFLEFNDFLDLADELLDAMDLGGILQIAPFHPQFQFDGTTPEDIGNYTNRSPYPTLHLLREDSLDKAIEQFPEAEAIFERNITVVQELGIQGWQALDVGAHCPILHTAPRQDSDGDGEHPTTV